MKELWGEQKKHVDCELSHNTTGTLKQKKTTSSDPVSRETDITNSGLDHVMNSF